LSEIALTVFSDHILDPSNELGVGGVFLGIVRFDCVASEAQSSAIASIIVFDIVVPVVHVESRRRSKPATPTFGLSVTLRKFIPVSFWQVLVLLVSCTSLREDRDTAAD